MAKKVIGAEIRVEGKQAEQSVGNFKKALREANAELIGLTEKFGATSKEATNAAKKVAGLKDAIGDARDLANSFNPDAKFAALSGAIQGAVSGFAALQGAQALFGSDSKALEETLVKVNAAMALSQGLNGVLAAKDAFVNFTAVIKTNVVAAFSTLRGAIISTGIGALAVGIGLIVTNFEAVKKAVINLIPGLKQVFDFFGNIIDKAKEWLGVSEDQLDTQRAIKDATAELADGLGKYYAEIERVAKLEKLRAQIAGKSQEQINKIDEQSLIKKKNIVDGLISQAKEYGVSTVTLEAERQKLLQEIEIKGLENRAAAVKTKTKEIVDNSKKEEDELLKFRKSLTDDKIQSDKDAIEEGLKNAQEFDANQLAVEQAQSDARLQISIDRATKEKELRDQALADEQKRAQTEIEIRKSVADSAELLSNVIGKQTAVGKALGIASALINTYQGATEVLRAKSTLPEPFGTINKIANVAAIIATGIKAVKAITAVKVPGGGSASTPPSFSPVTPQASTTQLNQNSINAIGNATSRAYVLETDVSGNQERIRRLNRAARIN